MERWTDSSARNRQEFIASLAILAFVALLPLVMGNEYWLGVVIVSMYFAMLAAAWNLLAGYTGQAPEQKPDQARDDDGRQDADERRRSGGMTALLSMENVTASYIGDIDTLRGVSLKVQPNTITGLIGLNGAGKSTIMKTICGFLRPKSGVIRFDGEDITGIASHTVLGRGIFYVPQESSLFPHMSVENNLLLPLEHLSRRPGGPTPAEITARLEDTFQKFPVLREKRSEKAGALSGGQQKMVEFAKAYLVRPRLCLIDEPAIGLAPKIAAEVYDWIDLLASERTAILLVDHNVRRVVKMSSYVYVLSLGQITAEGPREEFEGDLHEQVKAWLGITF